ncbi:NAD kinase isoform 1 [Apostichopus japonicus]|uniref:NAD(+) kinase n=1 Tax=Stichopus japonicus TaxID=307972 RepID=A0A2G8KN34_STIJA|nr:NAD kinase isoform 1 [Apostichopus japonicus]
MGKSSAERQRNRREHLKAEGKYDAYKKNTISVSQTVGPQEEAGDVLHRNRQRRERERKRNQASDVQGPSMHRYQPRPFGPKACLKKVPPSQMMQVTDPSSQKLIWRESPLTVLVIKKIMDVSVLEPFKELAKYLLEEKKLIIYVESKVLEEPELMEDKEFDQYRLKMKTFRDGDQLGDKIDFIVCLGGDGTLLYASSLFQEGTVPPVIAFHLGSFGFLTPYEFSEFREAINVLLEGNTPVTLRSRLKCLLFEDDNIPSDLDRENVMAIRPVKIPILLILNSSGSVLMKLPDYIHTDREYGLRCRSGCLHDPPNVPAILITPICPHTLSFRPIVVPAGVELKVTVSPDARHTAWVSLDGKHRQEIHKGWCLRITNSVFPVASVCSVDQIVDWFDSLMACMHWNEREQQKSFKPRERLRKSLPANGSSEKQSKANGGE